ncbi:MAG: antirestriction protein [Candidatus Thiodiazotropha sp.]
MIKTSLVPECNRIGFLASQLGTMHLKFEMLTYHVMSQYCEDYNGGYWNFYHLSNGGFYMALDSDQAFHVVNPMNYCDETMSAEAASIGANLYALSELAFQSQDPKLGAHYRLLYEFIGEHKEAQRIFRFID